MRDRDGLSDKSWHPQASVSQGDDPLAELTRIVEQGALSRPARSQQKTGNEGDKQPAWVHEIDQAFAQLQPRVDSPASASSQEQHKLPDWLRSPAAEPDRSIPGQTHLDVYAQYDEAYQDTESYHAQDGYQLAAQSDAYLPQVPEEDQNYYAASEEVQDNYNNRDSYSDHHGDLLSDDRSYANAFYEKAAKRRRLVTISAITLSIVAIAIVSTIAFRGEEGGGGEPPLIPADRAPVKVEPETPGGMEIPNTNRAIYEHTNQVPSGEGAVIIDNREQPVDVGQVLNQYGMSENGEAESQISETNSTTVGNGIAHITLPEAPEPTSPAVVLGEPKRVRTLSIRPDGSTVSPEQPVVPQAPLASTPNVPLPMEAETPQVQEAIQKAPIASPAPRPSNIGNPQQVTREPMKIAPQSTSSQTLAPVATGTYTVQLAASTSESDARHLFTTLQRRYSDLSSYSPVVVRAQAGERTVYRLRVGSFASREQATALCVRIQASGGQCFVARH